MEFYKNIENTEHRYSINTGNHRKYRHPYSQHFGHYRVIGLQLTVQPDERVFGSGWWRHIPVANDGRWTREPVGRGRGDAVARLARQPRRAHRHVPLAHYRVPPGHVGQHQTVNGGDTRGGRTTVVRLFALCPAHAAVALIVQHIIRGVQHGVFVVPRQPWSRPSCAEKRENHYKHVSRR